MLCIKSLVASILDESEKGSEKNDRNWCFFIFRFAFFCALW